MAFVAAPAWAGWEKVYEDYWFVYYIDPATIQHIARPWFSALRIEGDLLRIQELQNRKRRRYGGREEAMSQLNFVEYDCRAEESRTLSWTEYSEPMRGGKVLSSNDIHHNRWAYRSYFSKATYSRDIFEVVCRR
jgi:hypothetical protein